MSLFVKDVRNCPNCESKNKSITKKDDRYREFRCRECGEEWGGVRIT